MLTSSFWQKVGNLPFWWDVIWEIAAWTSKHKLTWLWVSAYKQICERNVYLEWWCYKNLFPQDPIHFPKFGRLFDGGGLNFRKYYAYKELNYIAADNHGYNKGVIVFVPYLLVVRPTSLKVLSEHKVYNRSF